MVLFTIRNLVRQSLSWILSAIGQRAAILTSTGKLSRKNFEKQDGRIIDRLDPSGEYTPLRQRSSSVTRLPSHRKPFAMEFSFPPAPPLYSIVMAARCMLIVWSLIGVGIVATRLRHWKAVRPTEIMRWVGAAAIGCVVALLGICRYSVYDDNAWNLPIFVAAISVSVAGITVCLAKVYAEGTSREKRIWIGGTVGAGLGFWLGLFLIFSPGLSHPAEFYRRTQCKNNLKQIGLAMHNFHDEQESFPPPVSGMPLVSWRVTLLPYLDQTKIYHQYNQKLAWDQSPNLALAHQRVGVFFCPCSYHHQDTKRRCYTAYSMLTGPHSVGANPKGTKLGDIKDGTSNTIMVVEACGAQIVWSEPRDVNVADQPVGINLNGSRSGHSNGWLSSYHSKGAHILLADGTVRFLLSDTDPAVLQKLAAIDDGDAQDAF